MPTPTFQPPQGPQDTAQLQDWIVKLIRDLNFMLGNLDTLNVNRLDAKVIIAQTITALQIAANTITADKMSVTQLSAIAANLGTITAGNIYGAYIATANGTYPRTELSLTGNQFAAYQNANAFVKMDPAANGTNPGFNFKNGVGHDGSLNMASTDFFMSTPGGAANIQISSGIDLFLIASNILRLSGTSLTMNGTAGVSGTVYVSSTSGGPATTPITFTNGIRTA